MPWRLIALGVVCATTGGCIALPLYPMKLAAEALEDLHKRHVESRAKEVTELGRRRPVTPEAVEEIAERLTDGNYRIREAAFSALEELGPEALPALPNLVDAVRGDHGSDRLVRLLLRLRPLRRDDPSSIELAAEFGASDPEVVDALVALAPESIDVLERLLRFSRNAGAIAEVLCRCGPAGARALLRALELPAIAGIASDALRRISPAEEEGLLTLAALATDADGRTRGWAAETLVRGQGPREGTIIVLLRASLDRDEGVRDTALDALARMGCDEKDALCRLAEQLDRDDLLLVRLAADSLGGLGETARPALPRLLGLLKHPRLDARVAAARALVKIDTALAGEVLRAIPRRAGDGRAFLQALGEDALPILGAALRRREERVRAMELLLAWNGGGSRAVPAIVGLLRADDARVRAYAAVTLGDLRDAARGAVPDLLAALDDDDPGVRSASAFALGQVGAEPRGAAARIAPALDDADPEVRSAAARAIAAMTGEDPSWLASALTLASPAGRVLVVLEARRLSRPCPAFFVALLGDPDDGVRWEAIDALRALGEGAREAVSALAARLKDPSPCVRRAAADALGELGPAAAAALRALAEALDDSDPRVREAAAQNIELIRGAP